MNDIEARLDRIEGYVRGLRSLLPGGILRVTRGQLGSRDLSAFVSLAAALTSTSWDGDARSTTAKTLIGLVATFGVPVGIKAVLVRVLARDSASATAVSGVGIMLSPNNTAGSAPFHLRVDSLPDDLYADATVLVPCDANGDLYYQTIASGAGTLDVHIQVWGYLL